MRFAGALAFSLVRLHLPGLGCSLRSLMPSAPSTRVRLRVSGLSGHRSLWHRLGSIFPASLRSSFASGLFSISRVCILSVGFAVLDHVRLSVSGPSGHRSLWHRLGSIFPVFAALFGRAADFPRSRRVSAVAAKPPSMAVSALARITLARRLRLLRLLGGPGVASTIQSFARPSDALSGGPKVGSHDRGRLAPIYPRHHTGGPGVASAMQAFALMRHLLLVLFGGPKVGLHDRGRLTITIS